ncbi:hypothetical protein C0Q70_21200 [Pomacea canaliculata]|uniref:Uncharacterized protein n=1 Tax=Pomacea canaliculata TaxID=400727 RepID=A0A2T7NBV1_POMCA|nr:hypothetical protein C0Q70_21200 [Pomacea canaliculata]
MCSSTAAIRSNREEKEEERYCRGSKTLRIVLCRMQLVYCRLQTTTNDVTDMLVKRRIRRCSSRHG